MRLVPIDHPFLWQPAEPVDDIHQFDRSISLMRELMTSLKGACLSAPQVGIPRDFFVTKFEKFPVVINPVITWRADGRTSKPEGSLSKPGWSTYVPRSNAVNVGFRDLQGVQCALNLDGVEARVFQHACDYLRGCPIFQKPWTVPNAQVVT